ncbi:DUF6053 domain-containing protein [Lysobacter sp. TAB13]
MIWWEGLGAEAFPSAAAIGAESVGPEGPPTKGSGGVF